jgi:metallo-beta-lactamase family protein
LKLSFHGADRGVTGSCHLVECAGRRILIDCGFYQGARPFGEENDEPFRFDPRQIDVVLLTHAHLDHCGRLPLLVKRGFRGQIVTTDASRELAKLVMLDAAHLLEQEPRRHGDADALEDVAVASAAPLYSVDDVEETTKRFDRAAEYGQALDLFGGVRGTFIDAGHILGSACIQLELEEEGRRCSILFSGDIGSTGRPLLRDPATPPHADVVVMEATYGDRGHRSLPASLEEMYGAITDTFRRGGNVIIPTFAIERAQELLYWLREGKQQGRVPDATPIFLDSPMGIAATEIFHRHQECYGPELVRMYAAGSDPFHTPGLQFTAETPDSIALNQIKSGAIILAGSGMCTGGRVRHHLQHNLWREASSIIFVGFAGKGTLARTIIDGAKTVSLFGKEVPVRARIYTINGFSAHADQEELLAWHAHTQAPRTILVHAEENAMRLFAGRLAGTHVEMPAFGESLEL